MGGRRAPCRARQRSAQSSDHGRYGRRWPPARAIPSPRSSGARISSGCSPRPQRLTLKLPRPNMASRDPRGLRFAVLIGVVLGFVVAGPRSGERLVSGLLPVFAEGIDNSVFVAWVAPPSYTQLPPRSLTDSTVMNKDDIIPAPINSTLVMRLRGTDNQPEIDVRPIPKDGQPIFVKGDAGFEAKVDIDAPSRVSIRLGSKSYGDWRFSIIPDKAPTAAFTETPQTQTNASLKLAYKTEDDYGVVKAAALIRPLDAKGEEIKTAETLVVELPVPGGGKVDLQQRVPRSDLARLCGHEGAYRDAGDRRRRADRRKHAAHHRIAAPRVHRAARAGADRAAQGPRDGRRRYARTRARPRSMRSALGPSSSTSRISALISRCARSITVSTTRETIRAGKSSQNSHVGLCARARGRRPRRCRRRTAPRAGSAERRAGARRAG